MIPFFRAIVVNDSGPTFLISRSRVSGANSHGLPAFSLTKASTRTRAPLGRAISITPTRSSIVTPVRRDRSGAGTSGGAAIRCRFAEPAFQGREALAVAPRLHLANEWRRFRAEGVHVDIGAVAPVMRGTRQRHALGLYPKLGMPGDHLALDPGALVSGCAARGAAPACPKVAQHGPAIGRHRPGNRPFPQRALMTFTSAASAATP